MDVPVFDLREAEKDPESAARAWESALTGPGCFSLENHGIPRDVLEDCVEASREFHSRPRAWKERCAMTVASGTKGYLPDDPAPAGDGSPRVVRDYASLDVGPETGHDPRSYRAVLHAPSQWPDLPGFRPAVERYREAVHACALTVSQVLSRMCGLDPGHLADRSRDGISLLRLLFYPERSREFGEMPNGHTDYEWFTLIWNSSTGLEVHGPDGRTRTVPAAPDRVTVLIGDLLEVLTGGRIESTLHWVRPREAGRVSLTYFYGPDFDEVVAPTAPRTGPRAADYPRLHAGDHLTALRVRHFRHLRAAYDAGALDLPFALPDVNPLKAVKMARLTRTAQGERR